MSRIPEPHICETCGKSGAFGFIVGSGDDRRMAWYCLDHKQDGESRLVRK